MPSRTGSLELSCPTTDSRPPLGASGNDQGLIPMHWLGSRVHGLATRISPPAFAPQFPASWRSHESAVVIEGAARAGARTWPQRTPLLARPVGLSRAI